MFVPFAERRHLAITTVAMLAKDVKASSNELFKKTSWKNTSAKTATIAVKLRWNPVRNAKHVDLKNA